MVAEGAEPAESVVEGVGEEGEGAAGGELRPRGTVVGGEEAAPAERSDEGVVEDLAVVVEGEAVAEGVQVGEKGEEKESERRGAGRFLRHRRNASRNGDRGGAVPYQGYVKLRKVTASVLADGFP